jgi:hypothetical protein
MSLIDQLKKEVASIDFRKNERLELLELLSVPGQKDELEDRMSAISLELTGLATQVCKEIKRGTSHANH